MVLQELGRSSVSFSVFDVVDDRYFVTQSALPLFRRLSEGFKAHYSATNRFSNVVLSSSPSPTLREPSLSPGKLSLDRVARMSC